MRRRYDQSLEDVARTVQNLGGILYVVGGAVRDRVMGIAPHDYDFVAIGLNKFDLTATYPGGRWGRRYPIYRFFTKNDMFEIGFDDDLEQNLRRRDITMNAMAWDILEDKIIDPCGGVQDIRRQTIEIVDPEYYNPLCVYRTIRQAVCLGFTISDTALNIMMSTDTHAWECHYHRIRREYKKAKACGKALEFLNLCRDVNAVLPPYYRNIE